MNEKKLRMWLTNFTESYKEFRDLSTYMEEGQKLCWQYSTTMFHKGVPEIGMCNLLEIAKTLDLKVVCEQFNCDNTNSPYHYRNQVRIFFNGIYLYDLTDLEVDEIEQSFGIEVQTEDIQ